MRRLLPSIGPLVAWLIWLMLSSSVGAQDAVAVLSGRVLDAGRCALPGAVVSVTNASGHLVAQTRTEVSGTFILKNLPPGNVSVRIQLPGFSTVESVRTLYPGNNLWDTILTLGRLATTTTHLVRGKVMSRRGRPVPNATVTLADIVGSTVKAIWNAL